ncbi:MAG: hypothetical protein AAF517_08215, partial [Planctomycetota bacterium]
LNARNRGVGALLLGADSHWFTYRRPIDIANEKLALLADLAGVLELRNAGAHRRAATDTEALRSRDARIFRGIDQNAVASFRTEERNVTLDFETLRQGSEIDGVYVRGSVIAGDTYLERGSRVIDSVLCDVRGKIVAQTSFLDRCSSPEIDADESFLHQVASREAIVSRGEVISDVYREGLEDVGYPAGQVRLRQPITYDPQQKDDEGRTADERHRSVGGNYTLAEVRDQPSSRRVDERLQDEIHRQVGIVT